LSLISQPVNREKTFWKEKEGERKLIEQRREHFSSKGIEFTFGRLERFPNLQGGKEEDYDLLYCSEKFLKEGRPRIPTHAPTGKGGKEKGDLFAIARSKKISTGKQRFVYLQLKIRRGRRGKERGGPLIPFPLRKGHNKKGGGRRKEIDFLLVVSGGGEKSLYRSSIPNFCKKKRWNRKRGGGTVEILLHLSSSREERKERKKVDPLVAFFWRGGSRRGASEKEKSILIRLKRRERSGIAQAEKVKN